MHKTQIIILAGGKGTRMKSDEPKTLTNLKGKTFLEHILNAIDKLALHTPPVIVVGHKKEKIIEKLTNGEIFAEQKEQLGTAHAVASAQEKVNQDSEAIVVLSGDQPLVSKETIQNLLSIHFEKKPMITMATLPLPDFEEWRKWLRHFGRVIRDEKGKVKEIVEYKDANEKEKHIKELNPAVYVFNSKWLWENIPLIKNNNAKNEYYLTDLIQIASRQGAKIETTPLHKDIEGFQPNTKEELSVLEKLMK